MTRLLVLGGSWFLGRAIVDDALARGWHVTTFRRGQSGQDADGAETVRGDRTNSDDLARLGSRGLPDIPDSHRFTWACETSAVPSPQSPAAALYPLTKSSTDRFASCASCSSRVRGTDRAIWFPPLCSCHHGKRCREKNEGRRANAP
ncbi:NAD-dependent epimerase/dehydratase family protein [Kibdelosporangium banguiense]|uniref:NAD-dependent epimerase/dehydratase family protein n=1 Tax=Kibdelosporangium banguiense TaxID=1365924 RepID=UPI0035567F84